MTRFWKSGKYRSAKQEIDDDMDKVSALKRKFKDISEIKVGDGWEYPFNYEQGMKELDEVLLKYIPFLKRNNKGV